MWCEILRFGYIIRFLARDAMIYRRLIQIKPRNVLMQITPNTKILHSENLQWRGLKINFISPRFMMVVYFSQYFVLAPLPQGTV